MSRDGKAPQVGEMVRLFRRRPHALRLVASAQSQLETVAREEDEELAMLAGLLLAMSPGQMALLRSRLKAPPSSDGPTRPDAPRG